MLIGKAFQYPVIPCDDGAECRVSPGFPWPCPNQHHLQHMEHVRSIDAHEELPWFEAVITPHRSLGPVGLQRLIIVLFLLSSCLSTGLLLIGAWPVVGFNGLEMGLALYLLRRNWNERHSTERLILSGGGLIVRRTCSRGVVSERRLDSMWLQALLEERPGRAPALLLVERARQMEVGKDLGELERRSLFDALKEALYRQRNPIFRNPQLERT